MVFSPTHSECPKKRKKKKKKENTEKGPSGVLKFDPQTFLFLFSFFFVAQTHCPLEPNSSLHSALSCFAFDFTNYEPTLHYIISLSSGSPVMNPTATQPPPPIPPPQPHRLSTSCDRHPDEHFTGFCPSCLCERLAVLEPSSSTATSSKKPPPIPTTITATAALKAIFKPSSSSTAATSSSFFPELRRTKSFSASKNEGFSGVFEPQRKSCDVRVRSTLWALFYQDDEHRNPSKREAAKNPEVETEPRKSCSSLRGGGGALDSDDCNDYDTDSGDIIRVIDDHHQQQQPIILTGRNSNANPIEEILEEDEEEDDEEEDDDGIVIEPAFEQFQEDKVTEEVTIKPMKDHIDLDSQTKKGSGRDFKEIAGSFWSAASVFSKKLQKWRQKQKNNSKKRRNGGPGSATLPVEKPISRQYRETQSEIADYGFGRRSCDTDPRFSLDAGRISFDDPRYSFDEPRASWDGYLIGRTFPRMPTMLSVVEDAPVNVVLRSDAQIPVEEPIIQAMPVNSVHEGETLPGGSVQTRDYYSDSSSRRRKSFDRSNSIRKTAAAVVAEIDEYKSATAASVCNSKVSPASTTVNPVDYIHGPKLVVPDRDSRDAYSNSLRDDYSETFDMGFRDSVSSVVGNGERKEAKKSRRWSKAWNIWGFIHRRSVSVNKDEDDDSRYSRANGVERSFSESWPELRGEQRNGNPKLMRSNSSVSWRNSNGFAGGGSFGSARKSNVESSVNGRKKRDEFVLERNRSARYSPNNNSIDNGLLRFYLTPLRGSRRVAGWGKSKSSHAQSIARSVLRLY
ncbi:protein OCTOPUS [Mercurialis annua]|uniref:protein OCTOPUS n=1 Tax=Mercurialis annua TaxID=3986 RepID=UPI0024AF67EB|nr:protein OCTOPUS [Mercurialis annua]